jgi:hypothetical protein
MLRIAVSCGFALALLGTLAIEGAAQSSCSAENSLCLSRGRPDDQDGQRARCAERMAKCRRTGCWEHVPKYGGTICNLKKS